MSAEPSQTSIMSPDIADLPGSSPWEGPFPSRATATDIFFCFRLLLGRRPNREEWPGHTERVGEPLDRVVASYVNALEFANRALVDSRALGAVSLSKLPDFQIYTAADDAAVGYHVRADHYEPDVTMVFRRMLRPGMHVLDLGANIGYFTMLSASLVGSSGSVLAVEPNGDNARMVEASRRANGFGQVRVVQVAAGTEPGLLVLHRAHSNGTTSAPPDEAARLLDAETVGCVRAETLVPRGRRIGLIKVDVEGAEYLALGGCTRLLRWHRPVVASEFSPSLMPGISGIDGRGYLRWLRSFRYKLSVVMPDGTLREADDDAIMREHEDRGTDHLDLVAEPLPGRATRLARALGRKTLRRS
jgi:FkbM family methyltransferase